jgi:hypothetical protein
MIRATEMCQEFLHRHSVDKSRLGANCAGSLSFFRTHQKLTLISLQHSADNQHDGLFEIPSLGPQDFQFLLSDDLHRGFVFELSEGMRHLHNGRSTR